MVIIVVIGYTNGELRGYIEDWANGKNVVQVAQAAIKNVTSNAKTTEVSFDLNTIPEFKNKPYVVIIRLANIKI